MRSGRLTIGLALAVAAGVLFGYAWIEKQEVWLSLGVPALLAGVLIALSATRAPAAADPGPLEEARWDTEAAPALGEMLVSLRLISWQDLGEALARQRGSQKRLGKILVEMKAITYAQLADVLEEQLSLRSGKFLWRRAVR